MSELCEIYDQVKHKCSHRIPQKRTTVSIPKLKPTLLSYKPTYPTVEISEAKDKTDPSVMEQLQQQTGRNFTSNAVHTTLYRLEEKGFLNSSVGEQPPSGEAAVKGYWP